jgi:hypothetical protein
MVDAHCIMRRAIIFGSLNLYLQYIQIRTSEVWKIEYMDCTNWDCSLLWSDTFKSGGLLEQVFFQTLVVICQITCHHIPENLTNIVQKVL